MFLIILFTYLSVVKSISLSPDAFPDRTLVEEGRRQFEVLSEKSKLPRYGSCWKNAVSTLQVGCKYLTDELQGNLALKFTDCFLQMSGYDPLHCEKGRHECLQKLPDRSFNVYTEFYTHTQNMCYFLQSKVWHEETEKTIDKLSETSARVSLQLVEAEKTQNLLLTRQRESLILQQNVLKNTANLASVLEHSKLQLELITSDFKSSALEQKKLLSEAIEQKKLLLDVFETLTSLKDWAVGEISWIDSIFFYVTAAIGTYVLTSTPRSQEARLFIFLILTANAVIERFICSLLLEQSKSSIADVSGTAANISSWIWVCRKIALGVSILIILIACYRYCDYHVVNHKILTHINSQNCKIIDQLQKCIKIMSVKKSEDSCNFDESTVSQINEKLQEKNDAVFSFNNTPTVISLPYSKISSSIEQFQRKSVTPIHDSGLHKFENFTPNKYNLSDLSSRVRDSATPNSVISESLSTVSNKNSKYNLRRSQRITK